MRKTLIVVYSLSGNTSKVADRIAAKLNADIENIEDRVVRISGLGRLRCVFEAVFHLKPAIDPPVHRSGDYDLVILTTPVWAQNMSSPMRSFIAREKNNIKNLALVCTQGGAGGEGVLRKMSGLCGKKPLTSMVINEKDFQDTQLADKIDRFVAELSAYSLPDERS